MSGCGCIDGGRWNCGGRWPLRQGLTEMSNKFLLAFTSLCHSMRQFLQDVIPWWEIWSAVVTFSSCRVWQLLQIYADRFNINSNHICLQQTFVLTWDDKYSSRVIAISWPWRSRRFKVLQSTSTRPWRCPEKCTAFFLPNMASPKATSGSLCVGA